MEIRRRFASFGVFSGPTSSFVLRHSDFACRAVTAYSAEAAAKAGLAEAGHSFVIRHSCFVIPCHSCHPPGFLKES